MGIHINLLVSTSTTKEEWESVYNESLKLIEHFTFADIKNVIIKGIEVRCLVETKEYEEKTGWNNDKNRIGWNAVGDYRNMRTAESYYLPRELIEDGDYSNKFEDAMLAAIPIYLDYDYDDERFNVAYNLWGWKTQGESYHLYLLAVACMIESRLGIKAIVYGDITRGQCEKAVELANEVLDTPIYVPDRCDLDRLYKRVGKMPIQEAEKLDFLESFYLGNTDERFGEYLRSHFSPVAINDYWKKHFKWYSVGQLGFDDLFKKYLLWGFDFAEIFQFVNFKNKKGELKYEAFVKRVMDAKLHIAEKDCVDILDIDQDEYRPYSIYTYMAQFFFARAHNKKVNRYIPIEEIRMVLNDNIGDKCDVDKIIDVYLEDEAKCNGIEISEDPKEDEIMNKYSNDPSVVFKYSMDKILNQMEESAEKYDIFDYKDLIFYEDGLSVQPGIKKSVGKYFTFYNSLLEEETYKSLMKQSFEDRCRFLNEYNDYILIRDKDWEKIFDDIEENQESFARYYPMVRVIIRDADLDGVIKAIATNDEFYRYCFELERECKD